MQGSLQYHYYCSLYFRNLINEGHFQLMADKGAGSYSYIAQYVKHASTRGSGGVPL